MGASKRGGLMKIEQQTIRLPQENNNKFKEKAEQIGCSYNSFINVLLDLGYEAYLSKPNFHSQE